MKRLAFETLMDSGKVRVLFIQRHPDAIVPEKAQTDSSYLAFDYSKQFSMPGFKVSDEGIQAKLSFGGVTEYTFVPWDAVVALIQNGKVMESWSEGFVIPPVDKRWLHAVVEA